MAASDPLLPLRNLPALAESGKLSVPDLNFAPVLHDVINGQSLAKISSRITAERGAHGADRLPDSPGLSTSRL